MGKSKQRALTPSEADSELESLYRILVAESDLGAVLAGAAFLDEGLATLISAALVPGPDRYKELFSGERPLGSFSAKIRMAFWLGLIGPETLADLDRIRTIRNDFAHSWKSCSFDDQSVKDKCAAFRVLPVVNSYMKPLPTGREAFMWSVAILAAWLTVQSSLKTPAPNGEDPKAGFST